MRRAGSLQTAGDPDLFRYEAETLVRLATLELGSLHFWEGVKNRCWRSKNGPRLDSLR